MAIIYLESCCKLDDREINFSNTFERKKNTETQTTKTECILSVYLKMISGIYIMRIRNNNFSITYFNLHNTHIAEIWLLIIRKNI